MARTKSTSSRPNSAAKNRSAAGAASAGKNRGQGSKTSYNTDSEYDTDEGSSQGTDDTAAIQALMGGLSSSKKKTDAKEKARFTKATKATDLAIQTIIDEYVQSSGSRNDAGEQLKDVNIQLDAILLVLEKQKKALRKTAESMDQCGTRLEETGARHDKLLRLADDLQQAQREEKQEMSESHYEELEAALFKIVARGMKRSAKKITKVTNEKDLEKKKRMQMVLMTMLS